MFRALFKALGWAIGIAWSLLERFVRVIWNAHVTVARELFSPPHEVRGVVGKTTRRG